MRNRWKLTLFVALALLVTGSLFLPACNIFSGESASEVDIRITKLKDEIQANRDAINNLQQQAQEQQRRIDALTPAPPVSTVPTTPIAPPVSVAPTTPTGLLASASVVLGKLTITPLEAKIGQVVTMSIEVSNNSTIEGTYKVALAERMVAPQVASNILEYADLITLKPGETKTVTFTTTQNVPGIYSVEISGKVGQYTVTDVTP